MEVAALSRCHGVVPSSNVVKHDQQHIQVCLDLTAVKLWPGSAGVEQIQNEKVQIHDFNAIFFSWTAGCITTWISGWNWILWIHFAILLRLPLLCAQAYLLLNIPHHYHTGGGKTPEPGVSTLRETQCSLSVCLCNGKSSAVWLPGFTCKGKMPSESGRRCRGGQPQVRCPSSSSPYSSSDFEDARCHWRISVRVAVNPASYYVILNNPTSRRLDSSVGCSKQRGENKKWWHTASELGMTGCLQTSGVLTVQSLCVCVHRLMWNIFCKAVSAVCVHFRSVHVFFVHILLSY